MNEETETKKGFSWTTFVWGVAVGIALTWLVVWIF